MSGIQIKDIKGALLEKKVCDKDCYHPHGYQDCDCNTFNKAITQQGQVKIGLNREKLAKTLFDMNEQRIIPRVTWEECTGKSWYYKQADAIIQHLNELLEVSK